MTEADKVVAETEIRKGWPDDTIDKIRSGSASWPATHAIAEGGGDESAGRPARQSAPPDKPPDKGPGWPPSRKRIGRS